MPNPPEPLYEIVTLSRQNADELKRAAQDVALYVLLVKLLARGLGTGALYICALLFPIVFETVTTTSLPDGDDRIFDDALIVNEESDTQIVCSPADRPKRALAEFEIVPSEPLSITLRKVPEDGTALSL